MLRTYGRTYNEDGTSQWVQVTTDANGYDDWVWLTTLCQVLLLNPGESPFWADWGIPAQQSVLTQLFLDYYVALTQQRFAQYFASLVVAKVPNTPQQPDPAYRINVVTNSGAVINAYVPLPI